MTKRAREILRLMVEKRDHEDGELVGDKGQWWIGTERTSFKVVKQLLVLCLISLECGEVGRYEVYQANEEAKKFLNNPKYVPLIVRAMRRK